MRRIVLVALAALAGCSGTSTPAGGNAGKGDLETAAIAAGVIPDPRSADISGLFARETDRLCIVPERLDFRVGALVDYGDRQQCSGTGRVTRAGEGLHLVFDDAPGCSFDARFDGDRIVLPGQLPAACSKLCSGRASLSGLDVERLSESPTEAATLRDAKGRLLCRPAG